MTAIMTLTEKLTFYLDYPFVRYAIIVGLLIALVSSLLGVTLVLRHFSYIGDGLSHVAFGAMSVAVVLKLSDRMLLILPVTIFSAVILLKSGQNRRVKGDAAVAMLSVGALAFGYLTVNVAGASANVSGDVCSTLFGSTSILTLTTGEVALCAVLSAVTLMLFLLLYNRLFALTFDENFARVCGISVEFYNLLLAIIIAVIIVLAMNLVGALLVSALIIFPTMAAMRLFESFRAVTAASAAISVSCALIGILVSVLAGTPVGSTIVVADALAFGLSVIAARLRGGV
ncbi:MAG: metal ABC transporter permease [Clostridiales bacterium]|nr:metal ABC transporter permease [Clostridiales bacterium]